VNEGWKLRGEYAAGERGGSGFLGVVGFVRIYRKQPRCIRGRVGVPNVTSFVSGIYFQEETGAEGTPHLQGQIVV
jgi:hypothetical protein